MASRTCWNCSHLAHHTVVQDKAVQASDRRWFAGFKCDSCGVMSIAAAYADQTSDSNTARRLLATDDQVSLQWFPERVHGKRFDDVPDPVAPAASEAWACYSISQYRASVLMARAVVEATAKEQGFTDGTLVAKIDKLYEAETISKGVMEAAHEIRFIGNEMAHGDFVTDISEEDCADVLTFLDELLNEVYQRPARLAQFRTNRLARGAAPSPE